MTSGLNEVLSKPQRKLNRNLRKILMDLRKNTRLLRIVSHRSSPNPLEQHVRRDQMLDLAFASLLKRYLFWLWAGEEASCVHSFRKLGCQILPLDFGSLEHVVAAVGCSGCGTFGCDGGDLEHEVD